MSAMREIRRSRPWLGTFVEIRIGGLAERAAVAAMDAAFAEVAAVHSLMSFHEIDSDLSRLHRRAANEPVKVDPRTHEVLAAALRLASESDGCFDPTIAMQLVEWDLLPRPAGAGLPDPRANWRDVDLFDDARVRFRRPLWLDLGGIAKGYAVDRALAVLRASRAVTACINAGGDLRRFGDTAEWVELRIGARGACGLPAIELGDAAVASSVVEARVRGGGERPRAAHVNARSGRSVRSRRAVSVVAEDCMTADALTKVVLADVRVGARLLRLHRASACLLDGTGGWRLLGSADDSPIRHVGTCQRAPGEA
jgi:thiamine biosynthesis lipoprotein